MCVWVKLGLLAAPFVLIRPVQDSIKLVEHWEMMEWHNGRFCTLWLYFFVSWTARPSLWLEKKKQFYFINVDIDQYVNRMVDSAKINFQMSTSMQSDKNDLKVSYLTNSNWNFSFYSFQFFCFSPEIRAFTLKLAFYAYVTDGFSTADKITIAIPKWNTGENARIM